MDRAQLKNPKRKHPRYEEYAADERIARASYLARPRELREFLVPHRFEGEDVDPTTLRRAKYGYGVSLNSAWCDELMGHVQGAEVRRTWGELEQGDDAGAERMGEPIGGIARSMYRDATMDGTNWSEFFNARVLEWMLSSVGGCIVVDNMPGDAETQADDRRDGRRPFFRFFPASTIADFSGGRGGLQWVKFTETADERTPDSEENTLSKRYVLYELGENGESWVSRFDKNGARVGESVNLGEFVDEEGRSILPVVVAAFGEHPHVGLLGSGLLLGLAEIVVDLYNTLTEIRESYRDAAFSVLAYRGDNAAEVWDQIGNGSRALNLGDGEKAELFRISVDGAEVEAGLKLFALGLKNWSMSAKRKVSDHIDSAQARSGDSYEAEFHIDSRPMLVAIAETLDRVETRCMYLAAQFAGIDPARAEEVRCVRDKTFRPGDEAERINRLVGEFSKTLPLPSEAVVRIGMAWMESADLGVDLDADVDNAAGGTRTVREVLEDQLREVAEADQNRRVRSAETAGGVRPFGREVSEF